MTCMLLAGNDYLLRNSGKVVKFEWHYLHGPTVLNRAGNPATKQPGKRNPFWKAVMAWDQQGRRIDESGFCLWDKMPPQIVRAERIGKRTLFQHPMDCRCGRCELIEFDDE